MKVLMISTIDLVKNGISTFILNFSDQLVQKGICVDVAATAADADLKTKLVSCGVKFIALPERNQSTLQYFLQLCKIVKQNRYDVVHAHGNSCTLSVELAAAKAAHCPVRIAHSHNTTCEHLKMHKLLRPLFEMVCNGRLACSEPAGRWLFKRKRFTVIKNGVDLPLYRYNPELRAKIRSQLGVKDGDVLLGHVGYFNYQKNHEFLIQLFEVLHKKDHSFKLVCIGDGQLKQQIMQATARKGMDKFIAFTGSVNNVFAYLQAIDCLLLPSRFEGLPFVLIEAQASGLPCLVSEQVSSEADITGLLTYLPLDEDAWVKAIENTQFCRKPAGAVIEQMGYSIQSSAERVIDTYQCLLNKFVTSRDRPRR